MKLTKRKVITGAISALVVVSALGAVQMTRGESSMSHVEPAKQEQVVEVAPVVAQTPVEAVEQPVVAPVVEEPVVQQVAPQISPAEELLASYGWNEQQLACLAELRSIDAWLFADDKIKRSYDYIKGRDGDPCRSLEKRNILGWW